MLKTLITVVVLSVIAGILPQVVAFADPEPAYVYVDASRSLGTMPEIFRAGVFEANNEQRIDSRKRAYLQHKFFTELAPGMTTIIVPLDAGDSFDEYTHLVEKEGLLLPVLTEARRVLSGGGRVLFSLESMPKWLSRGSVCDTCDYSRYPPKDYNAWRDLVVYVVDYLHKNGADHADYRIWEEADGGQAEYAKFWNGTKEEFYLLYKRSVEAIKSVDPLAKITYGNAFLYDNGFLQGMIDYVAMHNLALDYLIYHPLGGMPNPYQFQNDVSHIQTLFGDAGLNRNVIVHPESWNSWLSTSRADLSYGSSDSRSPERDTEFNAGYVIHTLLAFDHAGITRHSFFSRVDPCYYDYLGLHLISEEQQFYGDWGMLTRDLVIKPAFNAFKALSMTLGKQENRPTERLHTTSSDSRFVGAISSITENNAKMRVVIANLVPTDEETLRRHVDDRLRDYLHGYYGYDVHDLYTTCLNDTLYDYLCIYVLPAELRYFASCLSYSPGESCFMTLPPHLQEALVRFILDFLNISTNPRTVDVLIDNLPFNGRATLTAYLIDGDHANSCRANKATETSPTATECGINGDVDRMVKTARADSKLAAFQFFVGAITDHGFSQAQISALTEVAHECVVQDECSATSEYILRALGYDIGNIGGLTEEESNNLLFVGASLATALEMKETLYYYGTFKAPDGRTFTIPTSIDTINRDPRISLEGSRRLKTVSIPSGTYTEHLTMQPNSVILMELSH